MQHSGDMNDRVDEIGQARHAMFAWIGKKIED
jgi:hypothetical protein